MIPFYWIISEPITDLRDREILFITARSAGYVVSSRINDNMSSTSLRNYYIQELYIKCNGIYIASWGDSITIGEITKDKRAVLDYVDILEMMRDSIRKGYSKPLLQK